MELASYSYEEYVSLNSFTLKSKIECVSKELENKLFWEDITLFELIMSRISQRLPKDRCLNRLLKLKRFLKRLKVENLFQWCSKMSEALTLLLQKFQIGHVLEYLILLLGTISRIYTLCKIRCLYLCSWYKEFFCWMEKFKCGSDSQIIFKLPKCLSEWIQKETNIFLTLNSENELNDDDSFVKSDHVPYMMVEDVGEVIGRDGRTEIVTKKKKKKKKSCQNVDVEQLKEVFNRIFTLECLNAMYRNIQDTGYLSKYKIPHPTRSKKEKLNIQLEETRKNINLMKDKGVSKKIQKNLIHKTAMKIFSIIAGNKAKKYNPYVT
ncbi:uncharacterized protein LOC111614513 isoform X2 [Centruroides sculpturatus]|uniref:uncharacterized protein LOC111614513 isoform X2 n=1 Tax=Centruroides sculpturatus TaxID=218467 RepID=UPI000C6E5B62|nr:uncharacterized protein LOC111614513 isoform X2 [Centruroides sculpturatus]